MAGEAVADSEYTIDVDARAVGADATAAQVNALGDSLDVATRVVTQFDGALAAAGTQLANAASLVDSTSAALSEAEATYSRLEKTARAAAVKVEKAAAAGKDTSQLQAAADAAIAAVREQADAVDEAKRSAQSAAKAHEKLAGSYRKIEKAANKAAEASRGTDRSFGDLFGAAGALGGPLGGLAGQISGIGDGLRAGGKKGGVILLTFAFANMLIMAAKAAVVFVGGIGVAIGGLLAYAIAADKATSDRFSKAWEKAGKNAKSLFEGVHTEKLVRPVESLLNLLNKNTSAGKGLAAIFETLLNPIIDGVDKGEPLIKEFFKGIIIGALKALIFLYQLRNAILRAVPKETRDKIKDFVSKLLSLSNAAKSGELAFKIMAIAAISVAIALGIIAVAIAIVIVAVGIMVALIGIAFGKLLVAIDEFITGSPKATKKGGKEAGDSFWQGMVLGILNGLGPVGKAAASLIKAAMGGAKKEADSHSPSRKLMRFGQHDLAGAVSLGMYRGERQVRRAGQRIGKAAVEGTTEAPSRGRSPAQQQMARQPAGGNTVTVHPGAVVIYAQGGEDIQTAARRAAEELIEMVVIQLGLEPVSGEA